MKTDLENVNWIVEGIRGSMGINMNKFKELLWSGRWSGVWVVKENGEYHACKDKWNEAGHHIDYLYHSSSLEEVIAYGERGEAKA